jgi:acetyl esterase/lipase
MRLWDNRANRFAWSSYTGLPPGSPEVSSLAAPARHEDLRGLPPAWIGVGTLDLFRDENVAHAERLRAVGIDCDLHVVDGAFHGFDVVRAGARCSKAFAD